MQTVKLSSVFLIFIILTACAQPVIEPVIKERTAPPKMDEVDETILFDFDSDIVLDSEKIKLENLFPQIQSQKTLLIEIHGHADDIGDNMYNVELAKRRAESVKRIFESSLTTPLPIKLFSWGEEIPKDDEESQEARRKNRRVEIVILP